ncbi:arv1-like related protein [Cyclospora cayetanensis]|uniref:Arv1-like related protein n=1 Tax=Cyclospora cayetanensis TaxID=88456 RepID=A0A1D3CXA8_9EIME|nr:arv1-like related protein [Cyclospora cayetanensis]
MSRWLLSPSTAAIEQQVLVLLCAASELLTFLGVAMLLTRLYVAWRQMKKRRIAIPAVVKRGVGDACTSATAAETAVETPFVQEDEFELGVLLTALGLSLYSKLGTLLVMAWHEALLLRHCVAAFTFSSNVVALNVFLHPSPPAAGGPHHEAFPAEGSLSVLSAFKALVYIRRLRV